MAQTVMYPGAVNSPKTTLSAGINDSVTTIPVTELGVFPAAPNEAVIGTGEDAETIYYGVKSAATGAGNLTTVTREFNKTGTYGAKKAWDSGTSISRRFTAYDHDTLKSNVEDLDTSRAPIASPQFTGTPLLPTGTTGTTQDVGTNNTTIATTAFVIANAGAASSDSNAKILAYLGM